MRIKKWLVSAAVLFGMAALFVPAVSAASVPTDGTGTVIENTTTDASQREFFTIKTPDGTVFYVVVDKTKTDDNVYLLTPVTEDSLKALAESAAQKNSGPERPAPPAACLGACLRLLPLSAPVIKCKKGGADIFLDFFMLLNRCFSCNLLGS